MGHSQNQINRQQNQINCYQKQIYHYQNQIYHYQNQMKTNPHLSNSTAHPILRTALTLTLAASSAQATVIAQYPFSGTVAQRPLSTDTELNSTAGDFLERPSDPLNYWGFSSAGNAFAQSRGTTASVANAVAADDYWSFTVTPSVGFTLDLTTLTFDTIHNATSGTAPPNEPDVNATMSVFVRSSIDGYASNIGSTFTQAWDTTTTGRSIDLSAPAFQDITTATTFRLYVYDSGVDTSSNGLRLDNVVLNGEVLVVPEPSSTLLVGGFGSLMLLRRRRR
jgi:hypothetical protein